MIGDFIKDLDKNIKQLTRQQIMLWLIVIGFLFFSLGYGKQLAGLAVLAIIYILLSGNTIEGMLDGSGFITSKNPETTKLRNKLIGDISGSIPEINNVEKIHQQIISVSNLYTCGGSNFQSEFVPGLNAKLDYYFTAMYNGIYTLVKDDVYPQHIMINVITCQQRILNLLQDFIFVGVDSHLAPELEDIQEQLKKAYFNLNAQIVEKVNNKDSDTMNNLTGYLDYPTEPLASGSFTSEFSTLY